MEIKKKATYCIRVEGAEEAIKKTEQLKSVIMETMELQDKLEKKVAAFENVIQRQLEISSLIRLCIERYNDEMEKHGSTNSNHQ